MKKIYKVNNFIKNKIVKLLDSKSSYLGILKIKDCLNNSKFLNLDLVEIGTKNNISICKIISYNKFKYIEYKKNKKFLSNIRNFKKNKKFKEVKFHLFTAKNDYNNKIKLIKNFLIKNLKVKITFIIKGREITKMNIIKNNIKDFIFVISEFGVLTNLPNYSNKLIFLYFSPKHDKSQIKKINS